VDGVIFFPYLRPGMPAGGLFLWQHIEALLLFLKHPFFGPVVLVLYLDPEQH
jgi:hypothetical protein